MKKARCYVSLGGTQKRPRHPKHSNRQAADTFSCNGLWAFSFAANGRGCKGTSSQFIMVQRASDVTPPGSSETLERDQRRGWVSTCLNCWGYPCHVRLSWRMVSGQYALQMVCRSEECLSSSNVPRAVYGCWFVSVPQMERKGYMNGMRTHDFQRLFKGFNLSNAEKCRYKLENHCSC